MEKMETNYYVAHTRTQLYLKFYKTEALKARHPDNAVGG